MPIEIIDKPSIFKAKKILITGGTGSLGRELTKEILKYEPKIIRLYSRGEYLHNEFMNEMDLDSRLRFLIGDIRDQDRLSRAMNNIDIVIHAAALKHVPLCEYNPSEAIKTNSLGSINIVECAISNGVDKVIGISTDKAASPVNLYGATKLIMEKLLIQANEYSKTKFCCVRYGNVIGSHGSIIPFLLRQREQEDFVTVTDIRMTRFWTTLANSVDLVFLATKLVGKGGCIFVPKLPSMALIDLVNIIAPSHKKHIIGIRPGEKLHEVLVTEDEISRTVIQENYYIINPYGYKVPKGSTTMKKPYTSDKNDWWLTKNEMKAHVEKFIEDSKYA